jgi:hypothetical protein
VSFSWFTHIQRRINSYSTVSWKKVSVSLGAASFTDRYLKLQHPQNISLLAVIFGPCSTFYFYGYRKVHSSWCFNTKTETKVLITWYSKLTEDSKKKESISWIECRSCFRFKHSEFHS